MPVSLATNRYVKALYHAARDAGALDALRADVARLGEVFDAAPELGDALKNPRIPTARKQAVLQQAGLSGAHRLLGDFVALALDRRRPEVVLELAEEFGRLDREARGIVVARIESARPLDPETRASLMARLEEFTGKSIELREEVVPALLGGLRILLGSRMYDGSVRRRLDDLIAHLGQGRVA